MTTAPLVQENAHIARRNGRTRPKAVRTVELRLAPPGATWPPGLLRDEWPFTGHRTQAEVAREGGEQ